MASLDEFLTGTKKVGGNLIEFMTGYTRSIGQGAMLGAADEAEATMRAGLGFGGYDDNLETIRAENKKFQQEHPYIATGTELAGATIPAFFSRGRTAPASFANAVGRNALTGAGAGAIYGFNTGEGIEDRMSRVPAGAGFGAAGGLVATPVAQAIGWGVGQATQPWLSRIRSVSNPQREAERQVARAIASDQRVGSRHLTPQETAYAQRSGQPTMNLDQGGEATRRLARSAANQSPEAGAVLQQSIGDRFEGQGQRINSWLRHRTGVTGDASATRDTIRQQARNANRDRYRRAYAEGDLDVWSPELERLTGSPDFLKAMRSAADTGRSRAVNEGMGVFNPGVSFENGILRFTSTGNKRSRPNLQYWDYVKRELDDAANAARRSGRNEEASRLSGQATMLRDELDRLVPSYRGARQGAATFFNAEDALEAGQNFINLNTDIGAARRAFAAFTPAEQGLFREGFVSSLMDRINRVPERADVVRRIWGNAKSREQINMVLGPQAREFEAFMTVETVMDAARGVGANSTTARQLLDVVRTQSRGAPAGLAAGLASGNPLVGLIVGLTWRGGRAIFGGAANRAMQNVNESVARRIATMLISDDPNIYRRGLQAVARNQRLMNNLRSYLGVIGGITAQPGAEMGSPQDLPIDTGNTEELGAGQ